MNIRPALCRERLREEGKPYPRSKCQACDWIAFSGPVERTKCEGRMPQQPPAISNRRPINWTDARALEWCAIRAACPSDAVDLARMWIAGEWSVIRRDFPDFVEWIEKR